MKKILYILPFICILQLNAQSYSVVQKGQEYYDIAFNEISAMLDGKQPLSIKRAVFLAEWAYFDGKLDYEKFCKTIDSATDFIKRFIKVNEMEKYKTAKNMALIEYFFRPYSGNGYKPFTYNFSDIEVSEDFTQQFVSKVMQTHTGQCRSLPMYYRVLAEAVDAEAYIAYAPQHVFIRYRDEDNLFPEDWVNIELTSQQLVPEFAIKEHFGISEKTIENKVYLYPLTIKETIASQLADLALGYRRKYKIYNDFTLNCADKSLIIAHRLSTVKNADKIVVLEKGKIVEQGAHNELTALKGKYFELVKNQLELGN